jgi:hypothetical protein
MIVRHRCYTLRVEWREDERAWDPWHHDLMADVTLNLASGRGEPILVLVKLQSPTWELNFRATLEELAGLRSIRDTNWAARQCLHIGESAGAPVHWSAEGETATTMVGHNDETWDIAVTIPVSTVDAIVANAAAGYW